MATVIVFNVRIYDARTDEIVTSRRMATHAGAEIMGGKIVEESAVEIDTADLVHGEQWTPKEYRPDIGQR